MLQSSLVKKCAIYSHALLRIHIIGGQRLVRIVPPSLPLVQQPGTSNPSSQLKHSSVGVIWMCRVSFTNSIMVQHCGLLPVDRVVILPCMLRYS